MISTSIDLPVLDANEMLLDRRAAPLIATFTASTMPSGSSRAITVTPGIYPWETPSFDDTADI